MVTSCPFSTVSFNTLDFLQNKLDDLVNRNKIVFYAFISHLPEDDETKNHIHLLVYPDGQIDTDNFRHFLHEDDPTNVKPLGCLPCKHSKFDDWYLYSKHDVEYLASKGLERKYHYDKGEFITSEPDFFNEEIHHINFTPIKRQATFVYRTMQGDDIVEMFKQNVFPAQQFSGYKQVYDILHQRYFDDTDERFIEQVNM